MSLLDFSEERRRVDIDGRRFVIRRITVAGVVRALALYGHDILEIRKAHEENPRMFAECGLTAALLFVPHDHRMLAVIRDSVETDVSESKWPLDKLALAIAQLSDWPKIAAALKWGDTDPGDGAGEDRRVVSLAKMFATTPSAILTWPFEAWVATVEALQPDQPKAVDPSVIEAQLGVPPSAEERVQ